MCWSNNMVTPIVLKKPLIVYKIGMSTTSGNFISLYQDFIYYKSEIVPTVEINPGLKDTSLLYLYSREYYRAD